MEVGNGNWTGIRNCSPMHLVNQIKDRISGISDQAEPFLTHERADLGSNQKWPLSEKSCFIDIWQDLRTRAGVKKRVK